MDAISEARLQLVNPVLADKIRKMFDMLSQEKIEIRVTQGLRLFSDQLKLWQQGRDENGVIIDKSKVVTNAAPGQSWHEFGLAVDLAPFENNVPDWNVEHPSWKRMVQVGESLGLFSGTEFHSICDTPHFQLTGKFPSSPTSDVPKVFGQGGVQAVWDAAQINA